MWAPCLCGVQEAAVITAKIVLCFHDTEMSHYGYGSIGEQSQMNKEDPRMAVVLLLTER